MKTTVKELKKIQRENKTNSVEFVRYSSSRHSLHTDFIDWLDWEIDRMNEEEVVYYYDYYIMNAKQYNSTLYANCGESVSDDDDNMPVMVVVAEPATYRIVFDSDTDSMMDSRIFDSVADAVGEIKRSSYYDDFLGGTARVICEQDDDSTTLHEEEVEEKC